MRVLQISVVVIASWVYEFLKLINMYILHEDILLYVNSTSIKSVNKTNKNKKNIKKGLKNRQKSRLLIEPENDFFIIAKEDS